VDGPRLKAIAFEIKFMLIPTSNIIPIIALDKNRNNGLSIFLILKENIYQ
jgi:hypothetical protein